MPTRNDSETGARKFTLRPDATDTDRDNIDAAENKRLATARVCRRISTKT
jgi:hypothetical protein